MKTKSESKVPSLSENLTLQAIIQYVGKDRIRNSVFEPNGCTTVPDYMLEYEKPDGSIIPINLEIISVFGHQMYQNTNVLTTYQPIDPLYGLNKRFKSFDCSFMQDGTTITIYFFKEILFGTKLEISISKLAKLLYQKVKALYEQNKIGDRVNFTIDRKGKEFSFHVTQTNSFLKEPPRIILMQPQLEFVEKEVLPWCNLKNAIKEKEKKLCSIQGEKWLGIYNEDICLDISEYSAPYHSHIKEGFRHPFSKIFVISGDTSSNITPDIIELTEKYEI